MLLYVVLWMQIQHQWMHEISMYQEPLAGA